MKTLDWYGLYSEGWQNEIVSEAFSHPAKFARGLIRRIYEHVLERGWLEEGDAVLDPFAGVALGGLDAMFHGLHWTGVELEGKFMALGGQNIDLWNSRYNNGMLPRWGSAAILQGDSRDLLAVLGGARAQACVSSPPYAGIGMQEKSPTIGSDPRPGDVRQYRRKSPVREYSDNPANLGNMREGDYAAVVSSPAYAGGCAHTGGDDPKPEHVEGGELRFVEYGRSAGQLATMKEGDVDAVISSPPYADAKAHPSIGSVNKDDWGEDGQDIVTRRGLTADYGQSPGQLAAMPEGAFEAQAVVSSPPYEKSMDSGDENTDARAERTGGFKQGMDSFRYGQNPFTFLSKDPSGLNNQQRHELAAQNPQVGALQGDTFWSAAHQIVRQCWLALAPGGVAIFVLKDFIRDKKRVPFCDQWRRMCEACGFESLEWIRAWLVEDRGAQWALDGELVEKRVERKSFFRRLHEKKYPDLSIDYEIVLVMRKAEAI